MEVQPAAVRFRLEPSAEGVRALVPARKNWFALVFVCVWLAGWAFGEVMASRELFNPRDKGEAAFMALWLTFWTLGGLWAAGTLMWQLKGTEIIAVDGSALSHRIEVLGLGLTRTYRVQDVRRFRSTDYQLPFFSNQRDWFPPLFGSGFGPIAFDYGARTLRMASALDEAEARLLVRELAPRLPKDCCEP